MRENLESVKEISKTFFMIIMILPFLYSKGMYERTLLIKNMEVREVILPVSENWHGKMQEWRLDICLQYMKNAFSLLSESSTTKKEEDNVERPMVYSTQNPLRVLLAGDSLAMTLGYAFHKEILQRESLDLKVEARAATSLSLPEYFDWPKKMEQVISDRLYDLVLIHIGANDAQSIRHENKNLKFGSDEWKEIYFKRIQSFIQIAKKYNPKIYWIGLPPMQPSGFNKEVAILNEMTRQVCEQENVVFIPTTYVLGDSNGNFTKIKTYNGRSVEIRAEDGIHSSGYGANLVRDFLLVQIRRDFVFE